MMVCIPILARSLSRFWNHTWMPLYEGLCSYVHPSLLASALGHRRGQPQSLQFSALFSTSTLSLDFSALPLDSAAVFLLQVPEELRQPQLNPPQTRTSTVHFSSPSLPLTLFSSSSAVSSSFLRREAGRPKPLRSIVQLRLGTSECFTIRFSLRSLFLLVAIFALLGLLERQGKSHRNCNMVFDGLA